MKFKRISKARRCPLCAENTDVDFKDVSLLRKYISERGKIIGRVRSGLCARHQRQMTTGVKRARYMALLPFVQS